MAISYIGGNSADTDVVSLPSGSQAGDTVIAFAWSQSGFPSYSGWTVLVDGNVLAGPPPPAMLDEYWFIVLCKTLSSTDISNGSITFSGQSHLSIAVYRGPTGVRNASLNNYDASSTVLLQGQTGFPSGSWQVGYATCFSNSGSLNIKSLSMTSYTNRSSGWTSLNYGLWDSNGTTTGIAAQTATMAVNFGNASVTFELYETTSSNLTANSISSVSTVASATLNQRHNLNATGVSSNSNVVTATFSQRHSLVGVAVASTTFVASNPINQIHSLAASGISSASSVSQPSVSVRSNLGAIGVSSQTSVANPAIAQQHLLAASSIASNSHVGIPSSGSNISLTANAITSPSVVGQPSVGQQHSLAGVDVSSASFVGVPSTGSNVSLTANGVTSASTVGTAAITQTHAVQGVSVASNSTVAQPVISIRSNLSASGISSTTFSGTASLSQRHSLTATGISSTSTVGMPSSGSNFSFEANHIVAATTVASPTFTQSHSFTPQPISSSTKVGNPSITVNSGQGLMVAQCRPEDNCCGNGRVCDHYLRYENCLLTWDANSADVAELRKDGVLISISKTGKIGKPNPGTYELLSYCGSATRASSVVVGSSQAIVCSSYNCCYLLELNNPSITLMLTLSNLPPYPAYSGMAGTYVMTYETPGFFPGECRRFQRLTNIVGCGGPAYGVNGCIYGIQLDWFWSMNSGVSSFPRLICDTNLITATVVPCVSGGPFLVQSNTANLTSCMLPQSGTIAIKNLGNFFSGGSSYYGPPGSDWNVNFKISI